jgi:hypothetical protein
MKHPQLLNQEQMVCRRNGMMLANIQTMGPKGPTAQQGLMYALTAPDAVCFDGWRPKYRKPGGLVEEVIPKLVAVMKEVAAGNSRAATKMAEAMLEDLIEQSPPKTTGTFT